MPHCIVLDVLACPCTLNGLQLYVFYEWETDGQVLSDIFEKSFTILFLVVVMFQAK